MNEEVTKGSGNGAAAPEPAEEPRPAAFKVTDRRFQNVDQEQLEAEGGRPRLPSYVEQLRQQVEEKDRQLREYIAAYKREVVEGLEKTKQRLERDAAQRLEQLRGELAMPMMEVMDALERSLAAAAGASDCAAVVEGVRMVHLLMVQKLQELGLKRIEVVGRPFDPTLHEAAAIAPVTDPAQDRMVLAEFKPGFMLGDRLVRPALVQVGKLEA